MMEQERWQLNRAGLFNFWYFDDEELPCAEGKLLLRGSNGSGKSVTMQSLITVLLDGKKSPDRLDPFGSRARRMEDYLLGEKEVVEQDERTGYLYLEYARPGKGQYLTTGIGLRAKRQSSLDFWGFVILDNRRIGRDFLLYKTERDSEGEPVKIPLSRRELENRLGEGGQVVRTQQEYMGLVNKYVFGFRDLETFEDLMKLLIQLRSPKLSKVWSPLLKRPESWTPCSLVGPEPGLNLTEYFYPTPVAGVSISAEDIDNVLRTVLVGDSADAGANETVIAEDGGYRIGLIQGQAPREQESIYIGKEARRQYRLKEIARLEAELAGLRGERGDLVQQREQLEEKLRLIAEEASRYPSERELKAAYHELDSSKRQIKEERKLHQGFGLTPEADEQEWDGQAAPTEGSFRGIFTPGFDAAGFGQHQH